MSKMKLKLLFTFIALSSIITVYSVNKQRINEFINNSIVEALSNDEGPKLIPSSSSDWFTIIDDTKLGFVFTWNGVGIDIDAGLDVIICCGKGRESDYCNPYASNIDTQECKSHRKGLSYDW